VTARRLAFAVPIALALGFAWIGWHYSGEILGPDEPLKPTGQTVLGRTDSTITLTSTPKARRPGQWAILWPGGYGRIGPVVSSDSGRVVTRFERLDGPPPDTTCRLAGFASDADPRTWLGLEFQQVAIPARDGSLPAWFLPGTDSTWAVFLHGRGATRAEMLRMLGAYRSLGLPCLDVAYRNDRDGPRVGDGSYRMGATEWQDLEDAVRYARGHGARDVVTVGCSMGGGTVLQFLRKSAERRWVRAAVLDAPALDWRDIVTFEGRRRRLPDAITDWGMLVTSMRSGLAWDDLEQVRYARDFATPMLIIHGDADDTVPVRESVAFAAARPDLVTLRIVHGAGHVESSNLEPGRYAAMIVRWLRERGIGSPPPLTASRHP
jgi:pimeloyl-ACP methyl ester carboxylesterase